tara:strand:- start:184 stop:471 length:288 start_codon:yes stop_codon:yes gene_type:complete
VKVIAMQENNSHLARLASLETRRSVRSFWREKSQTTSAKILDAKICEKREQIDCSSTHESVAQVQFTKGQGGKLSFSSLVFEAAQAPLLLLNLFF